MAKYITVSDLKDITDKEFESKQEQNQYNEDIFISLNNDKKNKVVEPKRKNRYTLDFEDNNDDIVIHNFEKSTEDSARKISENTIEANYPVDGKSIETITNPAPTLKKDNEQ